MSRRLLWCSLLAGVFILSAAILFLTRPGEAEPLAAGPAIAAAALIEQGRYLATAGDCVACHTRPGGKPLSGGLAMTTDFGTIYTPNITPDGRTGIGTMTVEQFGRAMRQGVGRAGEHLYPVFPYTSYTKVSDADVRAIFAYLKSLPPVAYVPPRNDMKFPFNIRASLGVWKALYLDKGRFVPDPARGGAWNRGAYLVQGLGHCGECHTPRNMIGGPRTSMALTGGTYLDEVRTSVQDDTIVLEEGLVRPWSAVNLTSSKTGLGSWSHRDLQDYLHTGYSRQAAAHGPMALVVENSMKHLSAADIGAVALYLKSLPPKSQNPDSVGPTDQSKAGEIVYTARCGNCHLPTGLGIALTRDADPGKISPPLKGNAIVQAPDPASLINQILYGSHQQSKADRNWPKMPGFENAIGFDDDQIAALCTYVRSAWGNRAGACSAADVDKQR